VRLDEFGEVDTYLTAANEPILLAGERVIGFRQLEYRVYRAAVIAKVPVTDERGGWVWQTTKRVIHLDDKWETLPSGKQGKKVHEYALREAEDVRWKRRAVYVLVNGPKGKLIFEYKPFGASSRLFNWLKEQKEERRKLAKGEVEQLYERPPR